MFGVRMVHCLRGQKEDQDRTLPCSVRDALKSGIRHIIAVMDLVDEIDSDSLTPPLRSHMADTKLSLDKAIVTFSFFRDAQKASVKSKKKVQSSQTK
jgi:hypothetical protein